MNLHRLIPVIALLVLFNGPGMAGRWLKELNLTDAQKKQIEEIKKGSKDENSWKQMGEAREALTKALEGNASDDEIRKQYEKVSALRAEKSKKRFESLLKIRKVLTPEQRAKFKMHMHGGGHDGRKGKHRKHKAGEADESADEDDGDGEE